MIAVGNPCQAHCHSRFLPAPPATSPRSSRRRLVAMSGAGSEAVDGTTPSDGRHRRVAVVGAGLSGLSAAYQLKKRGVGVTVFEADEWAGGKIRSSSANGFIWDEGANTMTESEMEVSQLIDELGLRDKQQYPLSQHKRYVVRNGVAQLIPSDPITLFKSNVLSTESKLKLILEPFLWKNGGTKNSKVSNDTLSESVGNFFERHFGKEFVDYLIDPFLSGTSGGDPESLSICHAFPQLWNLEKQYGSIIVGAIMSKLTSKKPKEPVKRNRSASFSFRGGMQVLTDKLCEEIGGDNLKAGSKVLSLSCSCEDIPEAAKWSISFASNDRRGKKTTQDQSFDAVIMTAPISSVKDMKFAKNRSPYIIDFLPKVDYLPFSVVVTAFKKEHVRNAMDGFGILVPHKEQASGLRTLGTLFSSMMFPDRAPKDQHLYTTFIGGSKNRDLAGAPLDVLKGIVMSDLQKLLGVEQEPTFVKHIFWKNAFPMYGHDYGLVLEAIGKMEKTLPGFFYAGNNKDGLAVSKVIVSGIKAAELVTSHLKSP